MKIGELWIARAVQHHWNALDEDAPDDGQRWLFRIVAECRQNRRRYVLAAKCEWSGEFYIGSWQAHWFACGNRESVDADDPFKLLRRK